MSDLSNVVELPRPRSGLFLIETINPCTTEGTVEIDRMVECYETLDDPSKDALRKKYRQNLEYRETKAAELGYTLNQAFAMGDGVGKLTYKRHLDEGLVTPKAYLSKRDGIMAIELILDGSSKEEVYEVIHKEFYHSLPWDDFRKKVVHNQYFHAKAVINHFNTNEQGELEVRIKWNEFKEGVNGNTTYDGAYMKGSKTYNQMVDRSSVLVSAYRNLKDYDERLRIVEDDLASHKVKLKMLQEEAGIEEAESDLKEVALELKKLGRSNRYIAEKVGRSLSTVKRWFQQGDQK